MTTEEIEKIILNIFERTRQKPKSTYDRNHFLDYLITPPATKDNIKNSFKGVRKYYMFFEAVEQAFGICFTLSDQDRFYSVQNFVLKTKERIGNVRGNKIIIRQRISERETYYIEFMLTMTLIFIAAFFKVHIASLIVTILWGIAMWWIIGSKIRDRRHNKRLFKRLVGNGTTKKDE
ncbi:hypothetical protein SanaruYs_18230 [Chryseotalea sanaruensis]|uniref:Uncharacterized protein n=2 Tax=Chryseotalea sanaruensis TaxID=2482724 RepID=A0A401U9P2_9BACT|nr:hypothetical protein SanaruYs_18230 [Chryseotalea sanaruensis]